MAEPWLSGDDCPEVERHASVPSGYVARAEDAERRLAAGEVQRQCPACGLWAIWDAPSAQALSDATTEQLRAELARRDGQPTQPVVNEVGAPLPPSNESGATLVPDWHAALLSAGLVRDEGGWSRPGSPMRVIGMHTSGVIGADPSWVRWWQADEDYTVADILRAPRYATEEEAARAWLAAHEVSRG